MPPSEDQQADALAYSPDARFSESERGHRSRDRLAALGGRGLAEGEEYGSDRRGGAAHGDREDGGPAEAYIRLGDIPDRGRSELQPAPDPTPIEGAR